MNRLRESVRSLGQLQVAASAVSFAVAIIGILYDTKTAEVKYALGILALTALVCAVIVQVQNSKNASFTRRALENLIRAFTPPERLGHAFADKAMALAAKNGLRFCRVVQRTTRRGFVFELTFREDAEDGLVKGFFAMDSDQVAEWSLLDGKAIDDAINSAMYEPAFTSGLSESWNEISDLLGSVATGLYPETVRSGKYAISSLSDDKELGVPCPPSFAPTEATRVRMMKLGDEQVPFLIFDRGQLQQLVNRSKMQGSATIAGWLTVAWGPAAL